MRIRSLTFARYGKFTDTTLDFGARRNDGPDFHIVYGGNEAGKTTTFCALLDLLFGFETQSSYAFLHTPAALRLGARLEIDGTEHDVVRMWKPRGLYDASEQLLPEGLFAGELAGLDRTTYRAMFALDDDTLEAGGEDILASRGDLGRLLFSAGAGLAHLGGSIAKVRGKIDGFYKANGRKHELAELKRRLADLKADKTAALDTQASHHGRLVATREAASAAYENAAHERGELRARLEAITKQLGVMPRLNEWQGLKAQLDALPVSPSVPAGWSERLPDLQTRAISLQSKREALGDEIARMAEDIAHMPVDELARCEAARIAQMIDLKARYSTAEKDLPDRRAALRVASNALDHIVKQLDVKSPVAPAALLLSKAAVEEFRELIEQNAGIQSMLEEASHQKTSAEGRLAEAETAATFEGYNITPSILRTLVEITTTIRTADWEARQRSAQRTATECAGKLREQLAALAPWQGGVDDLRALRVPHAADREAWRLGVAEMRNVQARRREELDALVFTIERTKRELFTLSTEDFLIDDASAATSRAAREAAWRTHCSILDTPSALAFEAALRADDEIVAVRFGQTATLADFRQAKRNLGVAEADLDVARAKLDTATQALDALTAEIRQVFGSLGAPGQMPSFTAIETWVARRDQVLDAELTAAAAEGEARWLVEDAERARESILARLGEIHFTIDPQGSIAEISQAAQAAIDAESARATHRQTIDACRCDLDERIRNVERAERRAATWRAAWEQATARTWFGASGAVPDAGYVRRILAHLADLAPALERRDDLADRIAKMGADQQAFSGQVGAIAQTLGLAADGDVLGRADAIEARDRAAKLAAATLASKTTDHENARLLARELDTEIEAVTRAVENMTRHFGVDTLTEVASVVKSALRREELAARIDTIELGICQAIDAKTIEDAITLLGDIDPHALEATRNEIEGRCVDLDQRLQELFAARSRAEDAVEAIGGDDAVARIEAARQTILLEIEDKALRHIALHAGIIAAEQAISAYRDKHRSSMMREASSAFKTISCGAYDGLVAQAAKDSEILVGLPAGGGSKIATDMSKGTRFQLYLALRVAGYREFAKARRAVPFFLDDVMETFDDARAEAALRVLGGMANTGQVVLLTHHQHICEIARHADIAAALHELRP